MLGDEDAAALIEVGRQWLMERQDPKTATWSDSSEIAPHILVNGIFKIWMSIPFHRVPVQYCEPIIDICLRHVDYRKDEVARLAAGYLPELECMVQGDGGMSYFPDGSREHKLVPGIRQSTLDGPVHLGWDGSSLPGVGPARQPLWAA